MKKIGIIGGAGPLASALFYEMIIHESYQNDLAVPEIFLINYPFARGLSVEESMENKNSIEDQLSYCVNVLRRNGVDLGILACNTLHLYLKALPVSGISFIPLPSIVLDVAVKNNHHKLLLFGTQNTCRSFLYHRQGVEVLSPPQHEQELVDQIIDRILAGRIYQEDAHAIGQIIQRLTAEMDFDGVILGCTDLPVLHHYYPIHSFKPIYDSIKNPVQFLRGML